MCDPDHHHPLNDLSGDVQQLSVLQMWEDWTLRQRVSGGSELRDQRQQCSVLQVWQSGTLRQGLSRAGAGGCEGGEERQGEHEREEWSPGEGVWSGGRSQVLQVWEIWTLLQTLQRWWWERQVLQMLWIRTHCKVEDCKPWQSQESPISGTALRTETSQCVTTVTRLVTFSRTVPMLAPRHVTSAEASDTYWRSVPAECDRYMIKWCQMMY